MKLVLFFIVLIMHFITKRYNEKDCLEDYPFIDLLIVLLHTSTLGYLFYTIVSLNSPLIALFCAYVLFENIDWLVICIKGDEPKGNLEEDNTTEDKENSSEEEASKTNKK